MIDIIYLLQIIDKLYSSSTQRRFKEYMAEMPNFLSLQKEIDKYYKTGWKNIKEKINEERRG